MTEPEESTEDFIADLIAENCQYCKHMWEDIHTSPCICGNIGDAILYHARIEREKEFVTEWERQQLELQQIFGVVTIMPDPEPRVTIPEEEKVRFEPVFGDTVYIECVHADKSDDNGKSDLYCMHPDKMSDLIIFCGSRIRRGTCPLGKQSQPKPKGWKSRM